MKIVKETSFTSANGTAGSMQLRESTWNENELSLKFAYTDTSGKVSRGCPEVALDVAIVMVATMKENLDILPETIVKMLAAL